MVRTKNENGKPMSKLETVRQIVEKRPAAKATEISRLAKTDHGVDITSKLAATYRYHILNGQRHKNRKAVRSLQARNPSPKDTSDGIDDLLKAARKLGWPRVKEIVDAIVQTS